MSEVWQTVNIWTPQQCEFVKETALEGPAHGAGVQQDGVRGPRPDIRSATRWFVDGRHHPLIVETVWDAVERHNVWGFDIEMLPGVEVIRYEPGDFYKPHTDWGGTWTNRKLSVTIQLSDPGGYDGGQVGLHVGPEDDFADTRQGWLTVWPSWTLHSVAPVTEGVRWAAVGWVLGPLFR